MASAVFTASDPERAVRALHELDAELLASLARNLHDALSGSDAATRRYVADYRRLTDALLAAGRELRPDVIVQNGRALTLRDGNGRPADALIGVLQNGSAEAPFSTWGAGELAMHEAAALHLANRLRAILGLTVLAEPPSTPAVEDDIAAQRFLRRVRFYLNHPDTEDPLRRIMDAFALTKTDVAKLFGVSRQAVDGWLAGGVPPERQEKVATLLALCDLLQRKLKPERLPGVARRAADAYGGRTMLELIAGDRHRELLERVRDSFDWQTAA